VDRAAQTINAVCESNDLIDRDEVFDIEVTPIGPDGHPDYRRRRWIYDKTIVELSEWPLYPKE